MSAKFAKVRIERVKKSFAFCNVCNQSVRLKLILLVFVLEKFTDLAHTLC